MQYLYDVYDTRDEKYVIERKTAQEVEAELGVERRRIANYVEKGLRFRRRYIIEIVEIASDNTIETMRWKRNFTREWDKTRYEVRRKLRDAVRDE
jgi:hypothetical protein